MPVKISLKREGGSILADGFYGLVVREIEEKNGPSGHPYLNVAYDVTDMSGKPTGNRVWDVISLSPKAQFKLNQFLDSLDAPTEGDVTTMWFRGKKCFAKLGMETYNGNLKNVVETYVTKEVALQQSDRAAQRSEPITAEEAFTDSVEGSKRGRGRPRRETAPVLEDDDEDTSELPAEMAEEEFPL